MYRKHGRKMTSRLVVKREDYGQHILVNTVWYLMLVLFFWLNCIFIYLDLLPAELTSLYMMYVHALLICSKLKPGVDRDSQLKHDIHACFFSSCFEDGGLIFFRQQSSFSKVAGKSLSLCLGSAELSLDTEPRSKTMANVWEGAGPLYNQYKNKSCVRK